MLSNLITSLTQKDRTVALILSLLLAISTVSGVTAYIFKRSEAKDSETMQELRKENAQLRAEKLKSDEECSKEVARLHLQNLQIKDEFVNDLKEQRDKMQQLGNQTTLSVRKIQSTKQSTNRKLNVLKDEIVK